jgi:predicted dehydrogenase
MPCFVEKPFVLDAAEGARFAAAFDEAGIVNQVGYVNRWNDMFAKAREFVLAGLIGAPMRYRSEMYSATIVRDVGEAGWRASHAEGGGALFEMASHAIDLIAWFLGAPSRVGGTSLSRVHSKAVEDIVTTSLFHDHGAYAGLSGTLYVNWSDASYRKPANMVEIFGSRGKIRVDQHGMKIHLAEAGEAAALHGLKAGWNRLFITDAFSNVDFYVRGIEYTAPIHDFVKAVRAKDASGRRVRCSFADAARNLQVIEQILADGNARRPARARAIEGAPAWA